MTLPPSALAGTSADTLEPPARAQAAYGLLGLPLAMAALPIYVQVPSYYTVSLGLPLALTGTVLAAARLVDTVQDPWLGRWIDRLAGQGRLAPAMWIGCAVLALCFAALWLPPFHGTRQALLAGWLALMLIGNYTAHGAISIAYLAWGARLSTRTSVLTRAAAWREGAGLAGVLIASALPSWLLASSMPVRQTLGAYALLFALLLALGLALLLRYAPRQQAQADARPTPWRATLANPALRRLLPAYFFNALSVSVPATLALFFIEDRIRLPQWSGAFLGAYFLAGAAGLPVWTRLAVRLGVVRAWRLGMLVAIAGFVWATLLGPGDGAAYLAVCLLAGLALGADLALPPVLLAGAIGPTEQPAAYYGIWSLIGKLALALSALALPLLAWAGYQPHGASQTTQAGLALSLAYGGVPCLFKLAAFVCLRADAQRVTQPSERTA